MNIPELFHDKLSHCMDYSNYPRHHPFYSDENRLVPGLWKEEYAGSGLN